MNKDILKDLSYGVYLVSSKKDSKEVGCIANSVMQITSNPVTIAISIHKDNYTNQAICTSKEFICSILPKDIDSSVIGTFGFQSSKEIDKFQAVETDSVDGNVLVKDIIGYVKCKVIQQIEVATHTIFIGEVISCEKLTNKEPMTYAYYHEVKKGKSPKNAPTYQEEEISTGKKKFVCSICGYVHEADSLPDDFTCPICGVGKELFEEMS